MHIHLHHDFLSQIKHSLHITTLPHQCHSPQRKKSGMQYRCSDNRQQGVFGKRKSICRLLSLLYQVKPKLQLTQCRKIVYFRSLSPSSLSPSSLSSPLSLLITLLHFQVSTTEALQDTVHSGWLLKCGFSVRTWKRRYFVLTNTALFYFKTDKVWKWVEMDA
jgi:PH domain